MIEITGFQLLNGFAGCIAAFMFWYVIYKNF